MTMRTTNPIVGVVELLRATPAVTGITQHVYGGEMPRALADVEPISVVVIARSGGATPLSYVRQSMVRIDVHCWGPTMRDAAILDSAVHYALRNVSDAWTSTVRLLDIVPTAGPVDGRDAILDWPRVFRSYDVEYQEELA